MVAQSAPERPDTAVINTALNVRMFTDMCPILWSLWHTYP